MYSVFYHVKKKIKKNYSYLLYVTVHSQTLLFILCPMNFYIMYISCICDTAALFLQSKLELNQLPISVLTNLESS